MSMRGEILGMVNVIDEAVIRLVLEIEQKAFEN